MKRTLEVTAKKVDDAINEGLKKLGVSLGDDNVDIKVIHQGGLFKKAKVLFILGKDDEPELEEKAVHSTTTNEPKPKVEPKHEQAVSQKTSHNNKRDFDTENKNVKVEDNTAEKKSDNPIERKPHAKPAFIAPAVRIENPNMNKNSNQRDNDGNRQGSKFNKNKQHNNNRRDFDAENKDSVDKQNARSRENKDGKKFEKRPHLDKPIVSAPPTDEHVARCHDFLTTLLKNVGIECEVKITVENGINVVIETTDSTIIGYRGEMLDSIQYFAGLIVNGSDSKRIRVAVDAMDYRQKRIDTLIKLAHKMADKAVKNNRKVLLEPMSSAERRVIHAALSENNAVITRSEGHEPNRRIVILAKR